MKKTLLALFVLGAAASLQADHGYANFHSQNSSCYAQRGYQETAYSRPPISSGGYTGYNHSSYYYTTPAYYAPHDSFAEQQIRMNAQNPNNHPGMIPPSHY